MATIFRRNGSRTFTIEYFEHDGKRRRVSAKTPERRIAERIAARLEEQAALRRAGLLDPRSEALAEHAARPIEEHVSAYRESLRNRERTVLHVSDTIFALRRVLKLAKVERLADITGSGVQAALAALRKSGLSARTANKSLRSVKSFTRFCVHDERIRTDPVATLTRFNEGLDRRLIRRALAHAEIERLYEATETGATLYGLSGSTRAMLYRTALGTGFRASELSSLTVASFRLTDSPPCIVVSAAYSKHRREDRQEIHPRLAERLREWLRDREPSERPFKLGKPARSRKPGVKLREEIPLKEVGARMLRCDAERAGIALEGLDFHSLRHSFISLVRRSTSTPVAQALARHSCSALTDRYSHVESTDLTSALEAVAPKDRGNGESVSIAS